MHSARARGAWEGEGSYLALAKGVSARSPMVAVTTNLKLGESATRSFTARRVTASFQSDTRPAAKVWPFNTRRITLSTTRVTSAWMCLNSKTTSPPELMPLEDAQSTLSVYGEAHIF